MKKVLNIILTVIMSLAILFAFLLVGVRIFGLKPYTVLSGSMEPNYHVGSLIYVKKVDPKDLRVDDPITYVIGTRTVVTHRIIEVIDDDPEELKFRTKGDNNDDPDGTPVSERNILGKPVFTIPVLGYFVYFIQHPPGNAIAIGLLVLLVGLTFLPDLLDKLDASEKNPEESPPPDEPQADEKKTNEAANGE